MHETKAAFQCAHKGRSVRGWGKRRVEGLGEVRCAMTAMCSFVYDS